MKKYRFFITFSNKCVIDISIINYDEKRYIFLVAFNDVFVMKISVIKNLLRIHYKFVMEKKYRFFITYSDGFVTKKNSDHQYSFSFICGLTFLLSFGFFFKKKKILVRLKCNLRSILIFSL